MTRYLTGALFVAVLFFGGCTTGGTPQHAVYGMQLQLDAALGEIEAYAALPECGPTVTVACHHEEALAVIIKSAVEADAALDLAETSVRAGGDDVTMYTNLARAALARIALELARRTAA